MRGYFDLGPYSRKISPASPEAQLWFDRGLVWCYGYHHGEAVACFERALAADPDCAMARWGLAYALGPNYNKPWPALDPAEREACAGRARSELARAAATPGLDPVTRALVAALSARYPENAEVADLGPWNDAFAAAMREVHRAHPDDPDVTAIFAEAIMNRTPWQLWNIREGRPAEGAGTLEAIAVLETAFARLQGARDHPGLLHMYVHLMEMSPWPERALWAGDRLASLVPDAGHLVHMGTHIDVLCGNYHDVVARNGAAAAADRRWLDRAGAGHFYTVYCCHNLHFRVYGAMFLGQFSVAMAAAEELKRLLAEPVLRPMADWFEGFYGMDLHVLVRFGRWQELTRREVPADPELYAVTTALTRYARGVAFSALGDVAAAEAEKAEFLAAAEAVPVSRMLFNNTCRDILKVAGAMLEGELAYRKGRHEEAFAHLRRAVALDDGLPYDEPWGWMQPTRHALGALLLEQGRIAEAEAVYRADLGLDGALARACQHPDNLWSLHGLNECLTRRGATAEVALVAQGLALASARAEERPRASCLCRMGREAA